MIVAEESRTDSRPSAARNRDRFGGGRIARIVTLWVFALMFLLPLLAFLLSPATCQTDNPSVHFKCGQGITSGKGFLGLGNISFSNLTYSWREVTNFNGGAFAHWMQQTMIVSLGGTLLAVATALPAGYAMARLRFRGRRLLLFVTLLMMVVPNTVLIIPLFLEVNYVGMLGSVWPVIVIMGFYPFGVYLAYIHYMTALPIELVEAARIDGMGEVATFFHIALPLAKGATAIIVFFSFVADWTNYFLPLVMFPDSTDSTISVGLQTMIGTSNLYSPSSAGLQDNTGHTLQLFLPQLALAAIVSMLPILFLFVISQRFLVRGQTMGAVKG